MYKLGRIRNPYHVFLLIILTLGIYGIIWFYKILDELRNYRGSGIRGIIFLVGVLVSPFIFFLTFPFIVFMVILSFHIPSTIDNERLKLGYKSKKLVLLGLLPTSTPIISLVIFSLVFFVPIPQTYGILFNPILIISFLSILNLIWVYYIQKNMNILWELASQSFEFAVPVYDGQTEKLYGDENDPNQFAPAPYSPYIVNPDFNNDDIIDLTEDEEYIQYYDDPEDIVQN